MKMKGTEIAAVVIEWLSDMPWEIYQEVQPWAYGPIADIVAVSGNIVWIIETKTTLSMKLMEQGIERLGWANYVSLAVPVIERMVIGKNPRSFAYRILEKEGIGVIEVNAKNCNEVIKGKIQRNALTKYVKNCLTEMHKSFAPAGNAESRRLTPWTLTIENVRKAVAKTPGMTLKELVDKIDHHYSGPACAKSAIYNWIRWGEIRGVQMRKDGRVLRLYPVNGNGKEIVAG